VSEGEIFKYSREWESQALGFLSFLEKKGGRVGARRGGGEGFLGAFRTASAGKRKTSEGGECPRWEKK